MEKPFHFTFQNFKYLHKLFYSWWTYSTPLPRPGVRIRSTIERGRTNKWWRSLVRLKRNVLQRKQYNCTTNLWNCINKWPLSYIKTVNIFKFFTKLCSRERFLTFSNSTEIEIYKQTAPQRIHIKTVYRQVTSSLEAINTWVINGRRELSAFITYCKQSTCLLNSY